MNSERGRLTAKELVSQRTTISCVLIFINSRQAGLSVCSAGAIREYRAETQTGRACQSAIARGGCASHRSGTTSHANFPRARSAQTLAYCQHRVCSALRNLLTVNCVQSRQHGTSRPLRFLAVKQHPIASTQHVRAGCLATILSWHRTSVAE